MDLYGYSAGQYTEGLMALLLNLWVDGPHGHFPSAHYRGRHHWPDRDTVQIGNTLAHLPVAHIDVLFGGTPPSPMLSVCRAIDIADGSAPRFVWEQYIHNAKTGHHWPVAKPPQPDSPNGRDGSRNKCGARDDASYDVWHI